MPITNVRQGTGIRVAAKFQSAQGVPIDYTEWTDDDILRADEAPAPDPAIEIISQTGTTGSPYEQDDGVSLVGIQANVNATIKPNPDTIQLFLRSLLGVTPTDIGGGIKEIKGFALGIDEYLTYLWDSSYEAIRAQDVWVHTLEWRSFSSENLVMTLDGIGFNLEKLVPQLTTQKLARFDTYSHKESIFEDMIGGTPLGIFASEQTLRIEHGRTVARGNSVAPNFVGKDGRIIVSGTIRTRLSDETAIWFDRLLALERSNFQMRYQQQDGKILNFYINNATFEGTTIPRVGADGTLEDFQVSFTARQSGADGYPLIVRVEE